MEFMREQHLLCNLFLEQTMSQHQLAALPLRHRPRTLFVYARRCGGLQSARYHRIGIEILGGTATTSRIAPCHIC